MKISRAKWLSLFFVIGMGALVAWNLFTPSRSYSESENRYLQSFPSLSVDRLVSGEFAKSFDLYSSDQFPLREKWVALKQASRWRCCGRITAGSILEKRSPIRSALRCKHGARGEKLPGSCRVFEGRTGQVARAEALRAAFPNGFHCAPRGFAKLCAGSGSGCAFAAYAKGARRGYPVLRSDAGLF